ncbi:hypothetical protein HC752_16510 [Vibrio sp. S9_S30]|uniref:hypothetical protein n=1 Tax=Vibrio sp. S9_S30 TaxID=2720226 RepID=UPI0016804F11|nr:hypothetical protein [Vibrio sp. S9_S30]MBD1558532.1 hypothetical protein [Vibrio sp. S9_S30]
MQDIYILNHTKVLEGLPLNKPNPMAVVLTENGRYAGEFWGQHAWKNTVAHLNVVQLDSFSVYVNRYPLEDEWDEFLKVLELSPIKVVVCDQASHPQCISAIKAKGIIFENMAINLSKIRPSLLPSCRYFQRLI